MEDKCKEKLEQIIKKRLDEINLCVGKQVRQHNGGYDFEIPPIIPESEETKMSISNYETFRKDVTEYFGKDYINFKKYDEELNKITSELITDEIC